MFSTYDEAAVPATFRNTPLMKWGQAQLQSIMKNCLSAIIAVTDLISPTPPILTGIGTLAWHRRSIWRYRPTPLKSFLRNTEVSVRLFVVSQIPAPSFPKENILPRPVFGTKKRSRIRTRIPWREPAARTGECPGHAQHHISDRAQSDGHSD